MAHTGSPVGSHRRTGWHPVQLEPQTTITYPPANQHGSHTDGNRAVHGLHTGGTRKIPGAGIGNPAPMTSKTDMTDTQGTAPAGAITPPAQPLKILFADDAEELREVMGIVLLDEGYQIQAARDGCEVLTMFAEFQPDLVILDQHMPLMNGSEACAVIREISDVPIIMFTSDDYVTNVEGAIDNGTTDFVLKSTGIAELAERVASHLAPKIEALRNSAESSAPQVSPSVPGPFTSTILVVDPDEQNRARIKSILTRLPQNFIEVDTGAEALSAIEQHEPDIVITEWSLPDTDAAKMLTDSKRGRNAREPITIVMSNRLSPEIQRKLQYAGIDNFMSKPLDTWKAELMIGNCVKQARERLIGRVAKTA